MVKEKNKTPSAAMRISWVFNKLAWQMLCDGESFADAEITNMVCLFLSMFIVLTTYLVNGVLELPFTVAIRELNMILNPFYKITFFPLVPICSIMFELHFVLIIFFSLSELEMICRYSMLTEISMTLG